MKANDAEMGMKSFDVISRKRWFAVCAAVLVMAAALVSQTRSRGKPARQPDHPGGDFGSDGDGGGHGASADQAGDRPGRGEL